MLHVCVARFDVTGNLENSKQGLSFFVSANAISLVQNEPFQALCRAILVFGATGSSTSCNQPQLTREGEVAPPRRTTAQGQLDRN